MVVCGWFDDVVVLIVEFHALDDVLRVLILNCISGTRFDGC